MHDSVNHPQHYTEHPSGIECITVVEHMSFNVGNAIKYLWRADLKGNPLEDLKKAAWYINREIQRRGGEPTAVLDSQPEIVSRAAYDEVVDYAARYKAALEDLERSKRREALK